MNSNITPHTLIDDQISAYNRCDLELFLSYYSENATLSINGKLKYTSRDEFIKYYGGSFKINKDHKVIIKNRIIFNDLVIDHEEVTGRCDGVTLEAIVIYKVVGNLIVQVEYKT